MSVKCDSCLEVTKSESQVRACASHLGSCGVSNAILKSNLIIVWYSKILKLLPPYSMCSKSRHLTPIVIFTSSRNSYQNICLKMVLGDESFGKWEAVLSPLWLAPHKRNPVSWLSHMRWSEKSPPVDKEVSPHQSLSIESPWPWAFWPRELWEVVSVVC